jgi:ribonuclease T2
MVETFSVQTYGCVGSYTRVCRKVFLLCHTVRDTAKYHEGGTAGRYAMLATRATLYVALVAAPLRTGLAAPRGRPTITSHNATTSSRVPRRQHCSPHEPCWPTAAEVEELRQLLDPALQRSLRWDGCPPLQDPALCQTDQNRRQFPLPSAIPVASPWDQPLYGLASYNTVIEPLSPLWVKDQDNHGPPCYEPVAEDRDVCLASTRNNALFGWTPAFTIFATTAQHVQHAVRFAVRHDLCVMVAGTGHDFINRHSCDNGVFIRTAMLKGQQWNLDDPRWADGSVKLGAGNTFHEVQKAASERGRFVSAGWAISVGVVGWSIGGGHGPTAPSKGMGVDNILEVEIVTADGDLLVANAEQNSDLWWAVRGGGGSTWGVITSITLRAHATPEGGFVLGGISWAGGMCTTGANGRGRLFNLLDGISEWAHARDERFSGLTFVTLAPAGQLFCGATWNIGSQYAFSGPLAGEAEETFELLFELDPQYESSGFEAPTYWDMVYANAIEYISPLPWTDPTSAANLTVEHARIMHSAQRLADQRRADNMSGWASAAAQYGRGHRLPLEFNHQRFAHKPGPHGGAVGRVGGVPSVSVSRQTVASGALARVIKDSADLCASGDVAGCERHEIYHDITGNLGSPHAANVSIGAEFREAMAHVVVGGQSPARMESIYYPLGGNSYLSESAFYMAPGTFGPRYWGDNYGELLEIKARYDPTGVFWCHHCVGDTEEAYSQLPSGGQQR